ncbi:uncharacterized protein BDV17DRAFT_8864 [Aspergillus undulatus]|uniref:uncharacterized protein n=1 Tax=Aspergillus undulatus TaxID=1810928 RepID=UPI003CCCAC96
MRQARAVTAIHPNGPWFLLRFAGRPHYCISAPALSQACRLWVLAMPRLRLTGPGVSREQLLSDRAYLPSQGTGDNRRTMQDDNPMLIASTQDTQAGWLGGQYLAVTSATFCGCIYQRMSYEGCLSPQSCVKRLVECHMLLIPKSCHPSGPQRFFPARPLAYLFLLVGPYTPGLRLSLRAFILCILALLVHLPTASAMRPVPDCEIHSNHHPTAAFAIIPHCSWQGPLS